MSSRVEIGSVIIKPLDGMRRSSSLLSSMHEVSDALEYMIFHQAEGNAYNKQDKTHFKLAVFCHPEAARIVSYLLINEVGII